VDDARIRVPPRTVLLTSRLRLEPVSARHADGLYQAALSSREQLLPWMPWARQVTLAGNQHYAAEAERAWGAGEEFHFATLEGDLVLGVIGLNRAADRGAELHYWIRSDRTGLGYATEAAQRLLGWGAQQLGLDRFTLWAGVHNRSSRRVAEKLGFRDLGPLPEPMEGGLGVFRAERYARPAEPDSPLMDQVEPLDG
jgi:RimJ/RimL family protein N-acetyltransferase